MFLMKQVYYVSVCTIYLFGDERLPQQLYKAGLQQFTYTWFTHTCYV